MGVPRLEGVKRGRFYLVCTWKLGIFLVDR